ncbi:MAG: DNA-binding protein, partial [Myxococcales bacterium]|nr:DNA-binding protein [Myxococcales bacterium]
RSASAKKAVRTKGPAARKAAAKKAAATRKREAR